MLLLQPLSIIPLMLWLFCHDGILLANCLNVNWIRSKIDQVSDQWADVAKAVDKTLPCHFTCPIGKY